MGHALPRVFRITRKPQSFRSAEGGVISGLALSRGDRANQSGLLGRFGFGIFSTGYSTHRMRIHSNRRKKKYRPFGAAFLVVLAVDIVGGSGSNYSTERAAVSTIHTSNSIQKEAKTQSLGPLNSLVGFSPPFSQSQNYIHNNDPNPTPSNHYSFPQTSPTHPVDPGTS
jgi:hypothetical protein